MAVSRSGCLTVTRGIYFPLFLCYTIVNSNLSMKSEFLYVKPRSLEATNRFVNKMDRLHSCKVDNRQDGRVFLSSISGRYLFSMMESDDKDWEIIK